MLTKLENSAGRYHAEIAKEVAVSSEKLDDHTCAAFKQQGKLRVEELEKSTQFIEVLHTEVKERGKRFDPFNAFATSQKKLATEAETRVKQESLKDNPLGHVNALLGTLEVAEKLDTQSWQDIIDALQMVQEANDSSMADHLKAAKDETSDTIVKINEIFDAPTNTEFCKSEKPSNHPDEQGPTRGSPVRTSKKLQEVADSAVSVVHHTGHMLQVADEIELEKQLYVLLDKLQGSLESKAKSLITEAFDGFSDVLAKVFGIDSGLPEFKHRKAELIAAEKSLKDAVNLELTSSDVALGLAKNLLQLKLLNTPAFAKVFD